MGRTEGSPNIRQATRSAIVGAHADIPSASAKELRVFLLGNLAKYRLLEDDVPKERSIANIIREEDHPRTEIDKKAKATINKLVRPWHLGLMHEYRNEITPASIPSILAVQGILDELNQLFLEEYGGMHQSESHRVQRKTRHILNSARRNLPTQTLKVGEAVWIARLRDVIEWRERDDIMRLKGVASLYFLRQILSIRSKEPVFNTEGLDWALRNGHIIEVAPGIYDAAPRMAT